jgi:hypothetical protein
MLTPGGHAYALWVRQVVRVAAGSGGVVVELVRLADHDSMSSRVQRKPVRSMSQRTHDRPRTTQHTLQKITDVSGFGVPQVNRTPQIPALWRWL